MSLAELMGNPWVQLGVGCTVTAAAAGKWLPLCAGGPETALLWRGYRGGGAFLAPVHVAARRHVVVDAVPVRHRPAVIPLMHPTNPTHSPVVWQCL